MLITIGEAVAYVVSGIYGDVRELGAGMRRLPHPPAVHGAYFPITTFRRLIAHTRLTLFLYNLRPASSSSVLTSSSPKATA